MFERYVPFYYCMALGPLPVHTNQDIFETVYFLTRIRVNGILNSFKKIRIRVNGILNSFKKIRIRVDVAYEAYRKLPKISPSMYKPLQI